MGEGGRMTDPFERELVVNWNEGEPLTVNVWTSSRRWIAVLLRIGKRMGITVKTTQRPTAEATLPLLCLVIRAEPQKRNISDAQRDAARARMVELRHRRGAGAR